LILTASPYRHPGEANPAQAVNNSTANFPPAIESETPEVSLDVGAVIDAKDPWGTSFTICNQGKETISRAYLINRACDFGC
jgi:hypothetical protein